ncbi:unnamed protein product [Periconia digitata]|uniref:CST complex subunit Stn1 N-terminal domain-containing protein n=1 Tax=Periconia digitata TaxID=1303443 RepID=A0A9W4XJH6_9PLEO|nr:unnamed protein product [Periconia digitata]
MSTLQLPPRYRLYPAYCFRASPTYDTWVKITAADVQALRLEPDFPGQRIYFHLNHPIRYVRLVGAVVAIEDINTKYTVLTIDDGSGSTIDLTIIRLTPDTYNPVESPSNTVVSNLNVISAPGVFHVTIDDSRIVDIGTVIKAKGTLSEFRGRKQVDLKRAWVVSTTNDEVKAWAETAKFKADVLNKAWRITSAEHKKITRDMKGERQREKEYERKKEAYDAKKREKRKAREEYMAAREARYEARRLKEERIMNQGALI